MPSQFVSRVARVLGSFIAARHANVSILFAFSLLPLLGLVGLGVDYGIAFSAKTKLDNAADAAALAAVATAKAYVAANPKDTNVTADAIAAGLDRAKRAFVVNAGALGFAAVPTPTVTLTRTKQTFSSNASYSTATVTQFGKLFGRNALTITGLSAASADVPSYIDFYLLVDVSGSMGLPATSDGQAALKAINHDNQNSEPEGCQFACHFPGYTGYGLALKNNIQLRSGAVNSAVCQLLLSAASPQVVGQYRVGIYPFIAQMGVLAPITTPLETTKQLSDCTSSTPMKFTSLLDTGTTQFYTGNDPSTGTGSGGTHFESVLPSLQATISPYGDGSSSTNSRPFVFIITDGMENKQHFASTSGGNYYYPGSPSTFHGYGNAAFDGSKLSSISPALCAALKNTGAAISILYIPYTPLVYKTDPFNQNGQANTAIPNLPSALQQCASPGYFRTANAPADITAALAAMFQQAIQVAHLVQ